LIDDYNVSSRVSLSGRACVRFFLTFSVITTYYTVHQACSPSCRPATDLQVTIITALQRLRTHDVNTHTVSCYESQRRTVQNSFSDN